MKRRRCRIYVHSRHNEPSLDTWATFPALRRRDFSERRPPKTIAIRRERGVQWRQPTVKETSVTNFGLLIAFLLPGFVALWGLSYVSEPVRSWFGASPEQSPSVGGFLYVTLASIVAGLTVSTVRWIVIDTVHHCTGITRPAWDFSRLQENVAAFDMLNEFYYRYYQFYSNTAVAILFANFMRHLSAPTSFWSIDVTDGAAAALVVVFLAGSRDSIAKYYGRTGQLLAQRLRTVPTGQRRHEKLSS